MLIFEPTRSDSLSIEYKKNNGSWQSYRTVSFNATDGRTRTYFKKLLRANEFQWRVKSEAGNFKLLEYRIDISVSEEDKN
jgi:hypothetical protein